MLNLELFALIHTLQKIFFVNPDLTFPFSSSFEMATFLEQVLFIRLFSLPRHPGHPGDSETGVFFLSLRRIGWARKTLLVGKNQSSSNCELFIFCKDLQSDKSLK